MKLLIVSDSPFCTSAYGQQALELATRLANAGLSVTYFGTTYTGQAQELNGFKLVPNLIESAGNELIASYAKAEKADVIFTIKDPYMYRPDAMTSLPCPWLASVPIDTEPVSGVVKTITQHSTWQVAWTPFSFNQLADEGFTPFYAPLGLDTTVFCPGDKQAARARLHLPSSAYVVAFVGANQSKPSRKGLEKAIMGFRLFLDSDTAGQWQDTVLYLHTDLSPNRGGIDVRYCLDYHDIPSANIAHTPDMMYLNGVPPAYLADLYRAADVLLNPAMGGGFELCGVEAQACGTPVITSDFTAMRDTVWAGIKLASLPEDVHDDLEYDFNLMAYRYRVRPQQVARALHMGSQQRGNAQIATKARQGALKYDWSTVFPDYWLPLFTRIEKALTRGKLPQTLAARRAA